MSYFTEGENTREERKKYQRTAKVLTLFIVAYQGQWLPAIVFYIWLFITPPPTVMVREKNCLNIFVGILPFWIDGTSWFQRRTGLQF